MYKCENCGKLIEKPRQIKTTFESYYGVPLGSNTYFTYQACPYCGSEKLRETDEEIEVDKEENKENEN